MSKYVAILFAGLAGIANLNASYIQIGGNTGLTSTVGITASGFSELTYSTTAFQGTGATVTGGVGTVSGTNGSVLCAGATAGTCTPQSNSTVPFGELNNEFATSNGVTFSLLNEVASGSGNYQSAWAAPNTGTNSITIPIGIFGVTNVYTMLNDEYGLPGGTNTSVSFNFTSGFTETFTLVNGKVIRSDFNCTGGASLANCTTNVNSGSGYATSLDTANMFSTSGTPLGAIGPTSVANVTAFNVWSGTYGSGTGNRANTTGNLYLDAQDFYLGSSVAGLTLANMTITDTAGGSSQVSRDILSAVTVQTGSSSTPEPSTWLLFATGLGAFALVRWQRKQKA